MDNHRKNLLSFGFVREYCNKNKIEFLPNDIVGLFVLWLSFCDQFDVDLLHKNIKVETKKDDKYGEYQQVVVKQTDICHSSAICKKLIKKGDKESWTFKFESPASSTTAILGIINNEAAIQADHTEGNISDFSCINGGYGLYLSNMGIYYNELFQGTFEYGDQFVFKEGDMITMELDLTKEKGILSFIFHADIDSSSTELSSNVLNDDIDVNELWRAAVALAYPKDIMCILPYKP